MEILEKLLLPTAAERLVLLNYLIGFNMLIHFPFVGFALGSAVLSLLLKRTNRPGASAVGFAAGHAGAWIIFGVLPLLSLVVLFHQYFYQSGLPMAAYLVKIILPCLAGFLLLYTHQRTGRFPVQRTGRFPVQRTGRFPVQQTGRFPVQRTGRFPGQQTGRFLVGLAGAGLILVSYFFITSLTVLAFFPERWTFVNTPLPHIFYVTVVIHYLIFLFGSVLMTGAGLLFFRFRWPESRLPIDSPGRDFVRRIALVMVLVGALVLPLLLLWDLSTLPDFVLSMSVFVAIALIYLLLYLTVMMVIAMLKGAHERYVSRTFFLTLALSTLAVFTNQELMNNANREHRVILALNAQKARTKILAKREMTYAKNKKADPKLGEQIYRDRCSSCHAFDKVVLGPAYNDVLPKYLDNPDALKAFLRKPKRVNQKFPPMPNPGLGEWEINAVVAYILKQVQAKQ